MYSCYFLHIRSLQSTAKKWYIVPNRTLFNFIEGVMVSRKNVLTTFACIGILLHSNYSFADLLSAASSASSIAQTAWSAWRDYQAAQKDTAKRAAVLARLADAVEYQDRKIAVGDEGDDKVVEDASLDKELSMRTATLKVLAIFLKKADQSRLPFLLNLSRRVALKNCDESDSSYLGRKEEALIASMGLLIHIVKKSDSLVDDDKKSLYASVLKIANKEWNAKKGLLRKDDVEVQQKAAELFVELIHKGYESAYKPALEVAEKKKESKESFDWCVSLLLFKALVEKDQWATLKWDVIHFAQSCCEQVDVSVKSGAFSLLTAINRSGYLSEKEKTLGIVRKFAEKDTAYNIPCLSFVMELTRSGDAVGKEAVNLLDILMRKAMANNGKELQAALDRFEDTDVDGREKALILLEGFVAIEDKDYYERATQAALKNCEHSDFRICKRALSLVRRLVDKKILVDYKKVEQVAFANADNVDAFARTEALHLLQDLVRDEHIIDHEHLKRVALTNGDHADGDVCGVALELLEIFITRKKITDCVPVTKLALRCCDHKGYWVKYTTLSLLRALMQEDVSSYFDQFFKSAVDLLGLYSYVYGYSYVQVRALDLLGDLMHKGVLPSSDCERACKIGLECCKRSDGRTLGFNILKKFAEKKKIVDCEPVIKLALQHGEDSNVDVRASAIELLTVFVKEKKITDYGQLALLALKNCANSDDLDVRISAIKLLEVLVQEKKITDYKSVISTVIAAWGRPNLYQWRCEGSFAERALSLFKTLVDEGVEVDYEPVIKLVLQNSSNKDSAAKRAALKLLVSLAEKKRITEYKLVNPIVLGAFEGFDEQVRTDAFKVFDVLVQAGVMKHADLNQIALKNCDQVSTLTCANGCLLLEELVDRGLIIDHDRTIAIAVKNCEHTDIDVCANALSLLSALIAKSLITTYGQARTGRGAPSVNNYVQLIQTVVDKCAQAHVKKDKNFTWGDLLFANLVKRNIKESYSAAADIVRAAKKEDFVNGSNLAKLKEELVKKGLLPADTASSSSR